LQDFPNVEDRDISDSSKELIPTVYKELPLPYIPNFSVVAAPFNTPGHQILGLLPKSEQITSKMLWVDDIQIPEVFQLVLALHDQLLSESFQPLVVIFKSEPLPANARILSYTFPRLRSPGGFFNPINSHLLAIPFDYHQFASASYLCLGLLNNFHPLADTLATQKLTPVAISNSRTSSQPSLQSPVIELPQQPVRPAVHLVEPAAVDFVTPSSPLPLARSDESILFRSLEQFIERYPKTPLFTAPENFQILTMLPEDYLNSQQESHPVGLVPKSMALEPNFLPMSIPSDYYNAQNPWNEFQVVAAMNLSFPRFFQPLILMKPLDIDLFNNGVKLPLWTVVNEKGKGQSSYQVVLIRNIYEPMPDSPYLVTCIVPRIQPEAISLSFIVKTPRWMSSPDVLDNPAIHPRVIAATSTSKSFIETAKASIPAVTMSEPSDRERRIENITTPIGNQSNRAQGKSLPSKKSWKNRPSYDIEPSVKVVKREPSKTQRSIWSYFGF
jgi:hypothetical protein